MFRFFTDFLAWLNRYSTPYDQSGVDEPVEPHRVSNDVTADGPSDNSDDTTGDTTDPIDNLVGEPDTPTADSQRPIMADAFDFHDSFEVDAFRDLSAGWTDVQLVRGQISIYNELSNTGDASVYMRADNDIGKSHLFKAGYWVDEGASAQVVSYIYIPSGGSLKNLYIMDWESKSVWSDENLLPNTQPGIRIGFWNDDGGLAVERGKMGIGPEDDFVNRDFIMPRDEWVKIEWRLTAGVGDDGSTQVLVNDKVVIDGRGTTYIDERVADRNGIILNDDYAFDRFKVGITANSTRQDVEMLVDDVSIQTWDTGSSDVDWLVT